MLALSKDLNDNDAVAVTVKYGKFEEESKVSTQALDDFMASKSGIVKSNDIESDDDLKTVGSMSPVTLEASSDPFVEEDWELDILRDSPYYCKGDELDESLTGPYKVLAEQQKQSFIIRHVNYLFQPALTHIPSEPIVTRRDRKFVSPQNCIVYFDPNQFDDAV